MSIRLSVDRSVDAAYIKLSAARVARTVKVQSGLAVDLDDMDMVVGIELLNLSLELPISDLQARFHLRSADVAELYRLRPSLAFTLSHVRSAAEGSTVGNEARLGDGTESTRPAAA